MANLKEIRARLVSVNSTKQITSAMKMVSASKLRRAQDAIIRMRPYAIKLQEILSNLSSSLDGTEGIYSKTRDEKNILIIAISSNRGLCGGFNSSIVKEVRRLAKEDYKNKKVAVLAIGKKVNDAFKHTELSIIGSEFPKHLDKLFDDLTFEKISKVAVKLMESYKTKSVDKIVLVYNKFKNVASQVLSVEQFLPVEKPNESSSSKTDYIFEPEKKEIVQMLIPKSLKTQLFKALLDSHAAEHGARMTAMHKATDNADDLLKDLRLFYNKARQTAITNEILEIVGGAEAING